MKPPEYKILDKQYKVVGLSKILFITARNKDEVCRKLRAMDLEFFRNKLKITKTYDTPKNKRTH